MTTDWLGDAAREAYELSKAETEAVFKNAPVLNADRFIDSRFVATEVARGGGSSNVAPPGAAAAAAAAR